MAKINWKRTALTLGLVLALTGVGLMIVGLRGQARVNQMRQSPQGASSVIVNAVQMWQTARQGCPTVQELQAEKFLDAFDATDQWGSRYLIECAAATITVHSLGPDRQLDTRDDVRVSKRRE